jgi:RNA polymerase sigma-70 factor (ECF subfamily)
MSAESWRMARTAWPTIEVSEAEFAAYLAERGGSFTSDLYLACACAAGDRRAVDAFESYCVAPLNCTLARIGLDADAIAEVKQRMRYELLVVDGRPRKILCYAGRGTLPAWVRVVAVHEARRMARSARRELTDADLDKYRAFGDPAMAAQRDDVEAPYDGAVSDAFDRALRSLAPLEQVMLRQHVIDGMSIDELGALHHVHRATAARSIKRARLALRAATKAGVRKKLELGSTEISSVIRSVRDRVEVNLRALRRRLR